MDNGVSRVHFFFKTSLNWGGESNVQQVSVTDGNVERKKAECAHTVFEIIEFLFCARIRGWCVETQEKA